MTRLLQERGAEAPQASLERPRAAIDTAWLPAIIKRSSTCPSMYASAFFNCFVAIWSAADDSTSHG